MKNTKIIIATHKQYQMPNDEIYLPVHVGKEGKEELGYVGDNTGINISLKNLNFCELTGLYWARHNLDSDYIGLAHYRRHFKGKQKDKNKFNTILTSQELTDLLNETDIVLPKKRKYYIETIYSHYAHTLHAEDLDITREIISEIYPNYLKSFDKIMKRRSAHMFNMFIMKKEYVEEYCDWLFEILFELEKRLDISHYSAFEARLYGRVSEVLLDVWLDYKGYEYKEIPVVFVGKTNWLKKGISFLKAKFFGKKYKESF